MDNCWDYNDGESERRMGKALGDGYREKAFLMTKIDGRSKQEAAKQLDESLRRLMPPFQSSIRTSMTSLFLVLGTVLTAAGQSTHNQKVSSPTNSRSAKISELRAVLAQAKSAALKIRKDFQRGLVLDEIGAAEAKAGLLDIAVVTANRAYPHTTATLEAMGEELGNSNDLPKAKALGRRLKGGSASSFFAFMARRQAEKGNIEEALRTTKYITAPEVRGDALEAIAAHHAARGDYDEATKNLALAKATDPNGRSDH